MSTDTPRPSFFGAGAEWADAVRRWWAPAPVIDQPILPGWTFALNNVNSTAPQTETDVVARHSYGRQLGRLNDIVALLLRDRPDLSETPAGVAFREMLAEIDAVKLEAAATRVEQLQKDLATLRSASPQRYDELRTALLNQLGPPQDSTRPPSR